VTEGRFTVEMASRDSPPGVSRDRAREFGIPTFVGHCYRQGSEPGHASVTLVSTERPDLIREAVLALPSE
jgi:hypothetical protein